MNLKPPFDLAPTFGELLERLFPEKGRPAQGQSKPERAAVPAPLSLSQFRRFMLTHTEYKQHPWVQNQTDPEKRDTVFYSRFNMARTSTYAREAETLKPLVHFYRWVATSDANPPDAEKRPKHSPFVSAEIAERAAQFADLIERCMVKYLPPELSTQERPFAFIPLTTDHSELLRYIQRPEDFPDNTEEPKRWRALCVNGSTYLYSLSIMLFQLMHLPDLTIDSPAPIVRLALTLARTCITYADYGFARDICDKLLILQEGRFRDASLDLVQLEFVLNAQRIRADAASYLVFESDRYPLEQEFNSIRKRFSALHVALTCPYGQLSNHLPALTSMYLEFQWSARTEDVRNVIQRQRDAWSEMPTWNFFALLREMLTVQIRAYSRAALLKPLGILHKDSDHTDGVLLDRLEEAMKQVDEAGVFDGSFGNRFVHFDTVARGRALLCDDMPAAWSVHRANEHRMFTEDRDEERVLTELSKKALSGTHRKFRNLSTKVMLHCCEASFLERMGNLQAVSRHVKAANADISTIIKTLTPENMFHTHKEIALLQAHILGLPCGKN